MDFEWLGDRQKPAMAAVLRLLSSVDRPLRHSAVVRVGVEASDLAEKSAAELVRQLAKFGAVRIAMPGGRMAHATVALTPLGRRWLGSDAGREVLARCALAEARPSSP